MADEKTPSEELAEIATTRLAETGLLRSERKSDVAAKVAAGRMTIADWKIQLEVASDAQEKGQ
jgi:hypothetical protein